MESKTYAIRSKYIVNFLNIIVLQNAQYFWSPIGFKKASKTIWKLIITFKSHVLFGKMKNNYILDLRSLIMLS